MSLVARCGTTAAPRFPPSDASDVCDTATGCRMWAALNSATRAQQHIILRQHPCVAPLWNLSHPRARAGQRSQVLNLRFTMSYHYTHWRQWFNILQDVIEASKSRCRLGDVTPPVTHVLFDVPPGSSSLDSGLGSGSRICAAPVGQGHRQGVPS